MKSKLALLFDFLLAVICSYVLASLFHTQFVLHELTKLGVEISVATRLSTSLEDLLGLLPAYGSAICLALLCGFLITTLLIRLRANLSLWLYPLAGGIAILVALLVMHPILDITLIAGARTPLGVAMQCLAGVFGGWVFMHERKKKTAPLK